jgi:hypothetical protein
MQKAAYRQTIDGQQITDMAKTAAATAQNNAANSRAPGKKPARRASLPAAPRDKRIYVKLFFMP